MTDNEIIKALEYCGKNNCCNDCPCKNKADDCRNLEEYTIDLINRQKASLNAIRDLMVQLAVQIKTAKVEAIKEFADRFKHTTTAVGRDISGNCTYYVDDNFIDKLVKEMTERD